jgi:hypothetical protein
MEYGIDGSKKNRRNSVDTLVERGQLPTCVLHLLVGLFHAEEGLIDHQPEEDQDQSDHEGNNWEQKDNNQPREIKRESWEERRKDAAGFRERQIFLPMLAGEGRGGKWMTQ